MQQCITWINILSYYSYWFSLQCFFGGATCDYVPGLRGFMFVFMYLLAYIGSGLLLRYAEGATYLAIVQVSTLSKKACDTRYVSQVTTIKITFFGHTWLALLKQLHSRTWSQCLSLFLHIGSIFISMNIVQLSAYSFFCAYSDCLFRTIWILLVLYIVSFLKHWFFT